MPAMSMDDLDVLSLDPRIRDYVLIPISVVVIMQGILRHFVALLLQERPRPPKEDDVRNGEVIRRSRLLRANCHVLTEDAFKSRRIAFLNRFDAMISESRAREEASSDQEPQMPMQNPEDLHSMLGMMRQNVANVVPNMLSMAWVSYFFSGFVLVKLPFPLTDSFKSMLQQGVFIPNLDSSYVSSLSWYFINLFGVRGLLSLFLDQYAAQDEANMMYSQMATLQPGPAAMRSEPHKLFEQEKVELEITRHKSWLDGVEQRVVEWHRALKKTRP
ncbi:ER membrane protein complex subunit 3 [Plasmodiophora brassicae]